MKFVGENNAISGATFITGTAYKQMRIYDTRSSLMPIESLEVSEYRVTKVCNHPSNQTVYIGDASGELYCYDLRTLKRSYTLNSSAGSIRDLSRSEDGNFLVSVSLDRFARIFDTNTNKQISQRYLNGRLNAGLFLWEDEKKKRKRKVQSQEDDDSSSEDFESDAVDDRIKSYVFSDDDEEDEDLNDDDAFDEPVD